MLLKKATGFANLPEIEAQTETRSQRSGASAVFVPARRGLKPGELVILQSASKPVFRRAQQSGRLHRGL